MDKYVYNEWIFEWDSKSKIIVNEVDFDYDLHCFEVYIDKKYLGSIYPDDIESMESCIKDLDDGNDPINYMWEDGMGNSCNIYGWGDEYVYDSSIYKIVRKDERKIMNKKLYFVETNAYFMIISDDGYVRRVISNDCVNPNFDFEPLDLLKEVEDDSSWDIYDETVEELISNDCKILAMIEKEL